jgi:P2-related tail formation protein
MRRDLLPRNATAAEKALSAALDRLPELSPGAQAIRGFKFNPVPAFVPFLIVEYGLGEIEDFFYAGDWRRILAEGIVWQRLRGTPAAMHRGLSWIGSDGRIEENPVDRFKWWWFQLHLPGEVSNANFVSPMIAIARASKPLRSEFARVTAGLDVRGFRLNASRLNGGGFLNS